jgi:hypothetical protein
MVSLPFSFRPDDPLKNWLLRCFIRINERLGLILIATERNVIDKVCNSGELRLPYKVHYFLFQINLANIIIKNNQVGQTLSLWSEFLKFPLWQHLRVQLLTRLVSLKHFAFCHLYFYRDFTWSEPITCVI